MIKMDTIKIDVSKCKRGTYVTDRTSPSTEDVPVLGLVNIKPKEYIHGLAAPKVDSKPLFTLPKE